MAFQKLITGIAHVGIRVRDLAISRAFYESLGFVFIAGPLGPEPVAILEHPGGPVINFILNASTNGTNNILMDVSEKYPGYTHMALAVSDVDAAKIALESLGVRITEGPVDFPGARAIFIRDPDGNVIEFNQAVA
ncbi:MAG: VOC family protein [Candidatus Binatia bacterium]